MKIKHFCCLFMILILTLTTTSCVNNLVPSFTGEPDYDYSYNPDANKKESDITPVLYKVSDENGFYVWLFGAISNPKQSYYTLPDYINDAFNESDYLAVKYDSIVSYPADVQQMAISKLYYNDDTSLKDHVALDVYNETIKIVSDNIVYSEKYDKYIASYWSTTIDSIVREEIGIRNDAGLDKTFLTRAKNVDKPIKEIEYYAYVYEMISGYSYPLQEAMLINSLYEHNNLDDFKKKREMLYEAWENGSEAELDKGFDSDFSMEIDATLYDEYVKETYTDRNSRIVAHIENEIETGEKVFYCLDTFSVFGKNSVLDMLKSKGYIVEAIKS